MLQLGIITKNQNRGKFRGSKEYVQPNIEIKCECQRQTELEKGSYNSTRERARPTERSGCRKVSFEEDDTARCEKLEETRVLEMQGGSYWQHLV